jgi:hypothetical protein
MVQFLVPSHLLRLMLAPVPSCQARSLNKRTTEINNTLRAPRAINRKTLHRIRIYFPPLNKLEFLPVLVPRRQMISLYRRSETTNASEMISLQTGQENGLYCANTKSLTLKLALHAIGTPKNIFTASCCGY